MAAIMFVILFFVSIPQGSSFTWKRASGMNTHTSITEDGAKLAVQQYLSKYPSYSLECLVKNEAYTTAVQTLVNGNSFLDRDDKTYWQAWAHFDSELFRDATNFIATKFRDAVTAIKSGNYEQARSSIGNALHTIQDFYSHSNWVEMGFDKPSPGTLGINMDFGVPLAGKNDLTCTPCPAATGYCYKNVVTDKLTTAYYGEEMDINGNYMSKNGIKCSHGGGADKGSRDAPIGGIDKDYAGETSPHGYLHEKAAGVATKATAAFIMRVLNEAGADAFEKFLGINQPACKMNKKLGGKSQVARPSNGNSKSMGPARAKNIQEKPRARQSRPSR